MTQSLPRNLLRSFLFAAVSLSLACPLSASASSPRRAARSAPHQTSEQRPESRPIRKSGVVKRIGRDILDAFLTCNDANVKKRRELLAYGPQFPDSYDESDFYFYALVDSNWPTALVYRLEQGATAVVTIRVKDAAPFTQTLTGGGMGREQTGQFTLPVYKGKGPHPARISLKATRDGPNGKERAEFRFVGAGAGEGALASAPKGASGLEVAALGALTLGGARPTRAPAEPQRARGELNVYEVKLGQGQGGDYFYSFMVGAKFNKWGAYIRTNVQAPRHIEARTIRKAALEEEPIGPRWSPIKRNWDGRDDSRRRVRRGNYWVWVKVWRSAENGAAWVADRSDPYTVN
jgi:hypothetical protein